LTYGGSGTTSICLKVLVGIVLGTVIAVTVVWLAT
jgi:hypothetical protein